MFSLIRHIKPIPKRIVFNSFSTTTQVTPTNVIKLLKESDWKTLVLDNKNPVIVDFYASWCGPCKRLTPILEKHVAELRDKVDLVMVDIDEHQNLAMQNNVEAIPNVKLFINGQVKDEFLGLPKEERIKLMFDKIINK